MAQSLGARARATWSAAPGGTIGLALTAASVVAVGWILVPLDPKRPGPLLPWLIGLLAASALAGLAPRAWVERWLAARERRGAVAGLLAVFFAVQVAMACLGYLTFRHYSSDLKLFVDLVQGSFRGQFIHWVQGNPKLTESYLAHHWALQTLLWLPAWRVWPDPRVLLLIQIAGYGIMATAVHRLASLRLGPGPWPLAITTAVLLVPSKDWALSAELGNAPFLAFLIVAAAICVHRERPVGFAMALILIAMSREDAGFITGVLAVYAWWTVGWRRLAGTALVLSGVWMVVLLKVVMPGFTVVYATRPPWRMYTWLGPSLSAALADPATPGRVLTHVLESSIPAILGLLASFGVLPLAAGASWVLLLGFAPQLMTALYPAMLAYHHAYPAIAVAGVMAIDGARALDGRLAAGPRFRLAAVLAVPATALALHAMLGYSPLTRSFTWSDYWPTPHSRALWATLGAVPRTASLAGSHHLSTHRYVGRRPGCTWEYVSLRSVGGSPDLWCTNWNVPLSDPFLLIDRPRPSPELAHLLTDSPYAVVSYTEDIALFRRGGDRAANRSLARWILGDVRDAVSLLRQVGTVRGDVRSRQGRAVRAPSGQAGFVVYGWYVAGCPRPHELVARLRGDAPSRGRSPGSIEIVADQGTRVLAERPLEPGALDPAEYRDFVLTVTPEDGREIEARIRSTGAGTLWVDGLALVRAAPSGALESPGAPCEGPSARGAPTARAGATVSAGRR